MGATQSIDEIKANLPEEELAKQDTEGGQTLLYKFLAASNGPWALATSNAKINWYDANEGSSNKTSWWLEIEAGGVDVPVTHAAELQADVNARTVTFYDAEAATVCRLIFPSGPDCAAFADAYHNKLYENLNSAGEAEKAAEWYFKPADSVPMDWDTTEDEPPATPTRAWRQSEAVADEARAVHALAMGAGDNSFLVQDSTISVLRNDYGAVHQTDRGFALTPPRGGAGGGGALGADAPAFTPHRVMLMKNETEMNMLTPAQREKVFQADLETGSVVRQWACKMNGVDVPMLDIANDTRDAQLDARSTFMGLDANRLCRWDQRVAEGVVQDLTLNNAKDYSRGTNFTCMATSGDGYVAVGSRDGRIRLYGSRKGMESYEFKAANTSLPGLGLPITDIDVSFDGRYVVATTDKYLVIAQTFFKDAKGADTNAFVSRMGSSLPAPRLLKLAPEDRMKVGAAAKFSKGKLTWITDNDMTERWVAAGCGNYTVLWNFRRVKSHRPTVVSSGAFTITEHYTLIHKDERVVQNAFLHDKYAVTPQARNALVVATEHRLYNCVDEDSDFE